MVCDLSRRAGFATCGAGDKQKSRPMNLQVTRFARRCQMPRHEVAECDTGRHRVADASGQPLKLKHWRGFPGIFGPGAAPVLVFA